MRVGDARDADRAESASPYEFCERRSVTLSGRLAAGRVPKCVCATGEGDFGSLYLRRILPAIWSVAVNSSPGPGRSVARVICDGSISVTEDRSSLLPAVQPVIVG